MYKRTEDGIVLVGQDRCRGWQMCVRVPIQEVYFNHKTGKAEKVHPVLSAHRVGCRRCARKRVWGGCAICGSGTL